MHTTEILDPSSVEKVCGWCRDEYVSVGIIDLGDHDLAWRLRYLSYFLQSLHLDSLELFQWVQSWFFSWSRIVKKMSKVCPPTTFGTVWNIAFWSNIRWCHHHSALNNLNLLEVDSGTEFQLTVWILAVCIVEQDWTSEVWRVWRLQGPFWYG